MSQNLETENVVCIKCGIVNKVPKGHLTEAGKKEHLCRVCCEVVVERQVEERRKGDRKLLVD